MEPVISALDVRRGFGEVVALDGISLEVGAGELVGLLGPNGAGKTTLLSLISGRRRADAGTVRIFGGDPRLPASRLALGTTPQETGLPPTLRVGEVVDFVAGHYADPVDRSELLARFDLTDLTARQTGGLSGGQQRRLAVALAFVGRPRLVLLDEPTTGLDVESRRALWQAIRDYHADGATILLTSHYIEEVEALAQRVVVIDDGRILADGELATVLARVSVRQVTLRTPAADDRLLALPGVTSVTHDGTRHHLLTTDSDALVTDLVRRDIAFDSLEVRGVSLEEAFLALTRKEAVA
ncbi:ABC transporter ATP-binding protein [Georgenia sunbinii]|uniref:ABC transporter ATP-binding protein n=1 Tax=Georgenia sunbinii TaxID=3117728 RepID=UPI002F266314